MIHPWSKKSLIRYVTVGLARCGSWDKATAGISQSLLWCVYTARDQGRKRYRYRKEIACTELCGSVYIAQREIQTQIPIGFCTHFIGLCICIGHCPCKHTITVECAPPACRPYPIVSYVWGGGWGYSPPWIYPPTGHPPPRRSDLGP